MGRGRRARLTPPPPCTGVCLCAGVRSAGLTACGNDSVYCPAASAKPLLVGAGYYSDGAPGLKFARVLCPEGQYCDGSGVPMDCPLGTFGAVEGLSNASCSGRCRDGVACMPRSTSASGLACPAGYFCVQGVPMPCPVGTYQPSLGQYLFSACLPCPAGTYNAGNGSTSLGACVQCPPFEGSTPGSTTCWPGLRGACVRALFAVLSVAVAFVWLPALCVSWWTKQHLAPSRLSYPTLLLPGIVASDAEPIAPGLSPDDVLTLLFTKPTNQPDVSTTAAILALLRFDPPLASAYRATWQTGGDVGDSDTRERLVVTLNGVVNADIVATLLSNVRVSVLPGGLRDAGLVSPFADIANATVRGTWGDASQPQFLGDSPVVALDFGGWPGVGVGDALVLRFNQPVARVHVATKADLDRCFAFDPPHWADDYAGTWLDFKTLLVNVTALSPVLTSSASYRGATAVGALRVTVLPAGNLTSYDGTSPACNASSVLTSGSWGEPVCDGGLHVYSSAALVAALAHPTNASYVPAAYTIQLSSSLDFRSATTTTVVRVASLSAAGIGLPHAAPPGSLRFLVQGLTRGTLYTARVAPSPPPLPTDLIALLPRALPTVFYPLGGSGGCSCSAWAFGDGCSAWVGSNDSLAGDTATPSPPVIGTQPPCSRSRLRSSVPLARCSWAHVSHRFRCPPPHRGVGSQQTFTRNSSTRHCSTGALASLLPSLVYVGCLVQIPCLPQLGPCPRPAAVLWTFEGVSWACRPQLSA